MTVLAVVQQGHAVVALGEVHPLLGAALEAGLVPGGVGVGLALDIAELDLEGGLVGVDVHGELGLQQVLMLLPVDHGLEVDAAAVYVNASTRFTDGGEFGLGAEIGISTQKLHVRGPMGLSALTTEKYIIKGDGQVR